MSNRKMTIEVGGQRHKVSAHFVVCPGCEGVGRVMNPSIASYTYSPEEFRQEFSREEQTEYFKGAEGMYGVTCERCKGSRVVLAPIIPKSLQRQVGQELARRNAAARAEQQQSYGECGDVEGYMNPQRIVTDLDDLVCSDEEEDAEESIRHSMSVPSPAGPPSSAEDE